MPVLMRKMASYVAYRLRVSKFTHAGKRKMCGLYAILCVCYIVSGLALYALQTDIDSNR